jgi:hypothetical protein
MNLRRHFELVENALHSNRGITVELLRLDETDPGRSGVLRGRVRMWDDSLLTFYEAFVTRGVTLTKMRYGYHFQDGTGRLIFRYDDAPHYPEISTYPHHRHVGDFATARETIEPSAPPSLLDVLGEIERHLET